MNSYQVSAESPEQPVPGQWPFRFRFAEHLDTLRIHRNKNAEPYDLTLFKNDGSTAGRWILPAAAVAMLFTGTMNMLLTQMLYSTVIPSRTPPDDSATLGEEDEVQLFRGPLLIQLGNSLGQACCLVIYLFDQWLAKRRHARRGFLDIGGQEPSTPQTRDSEIGSITKSVRISKDVPKGQRGRRDAPPARYIFSAAADFTSSIALIIALEQSKAYVIQIYRNFAVLMCAILSIGVLRRDLRVFHWIGIFVITLGLICVAAGSLLSGDSDTQYEGTWLTLLSCLIQVSQLIYEERLMHKYELASPYRGIGWTGTWEVLMTLLALVVSHLAGIESFTFDWYQLQVSLRVRLLLAAFAVSVGIFMSSGLVVTKLGAAILTSVIAATRQVPIWVVEVSMRWVPFRSLSLVGLVLCCLGHVIYNNVWSDRFCFAWYRRRAVKEVRIRCYCRKEDQETVIDSSVTHTSFYGSSDYSSSSSSSSDDSSNSCASGLIASCDIAVKDFEIADNVVKNAVVTTRHLGYGGLSDDTAWIYVKRHSEPLHPEVEEDIGSVLHEEDDEEEGKRILAGIIDRTIDPDEHIVIHP